MYAFQLRQVYSFDVFPVSILGNNFKNVTVVGILDNEQANKEIDTHAAHVQVYPQLPQGTPNRPDGYDYIKIKFPSGDTSVIGMAWIKEDTIVKNETSVIKVTIGNVAPSDVTRVRNALVQNGFDNIQIAVE